LEAFRKSSDRSLTEKLKSLIQEFITHENSRCRLIALKYTEAFLSSDDIDLRWMLLQSCGDNRDEIRNEASRLLDVSLRMRISIEVVITYLWDHLCADIIDPETGKEKTSSSQAFSPLVHQMCSRYLWSLLAHLTGAHVDLKTNEGGDDWMELAPKIAQQIKKLPGSSQERLTRISLQALKDAHEVPLFHIAACFSAACPLSGPSVALANVCIQRARGTTRSDMANVATHLATSLMNKKELESAMPAAFSALEKVVMIVSHFFELRIGLH
uniref:RICTOR_N domain-containing protein n=1 Tax=Heligmosomoides polygyrus TaxID=6339 RepID=A0A183GVE7_HELPZ